MIRVLPIEPLRDPNEDTDLIEVRRRWLDVLPTMPELRADERTLIVLNDDTDEMMVSMYSGDHWMLWFFCVEPEHYWEFASRHGQALIDRGHGNTDVLLRLPSARRPVYECVPDATTTVSTAADTMFRGRRDDLGKVGGTEYLAITSNEAKRRMRRARVWVDG